MCLDCGCTDYDSDHGDPRHITAGELAAACAASDIDPATAAQRIASAVHALSFDRLRAVLAQYEHGVSALMSGNPRPLARLAVDAQVRDLMDRVAAATRPASPTALPGTAPATDGAPA